MPASGALHWADRVVGDQWSGLQLTVAGSLTRAGLCVEATAGRRLRIRLPDGPRLWAQVEAHGQGLHWTRGTARAPILPPIPWPTMRRIGPHNLPGWARHYAEELGAARLLEAGQWIITPIWSPGDDPQRHAPPMSNLLAALEPARRGEVGWGINGAADVLALRDPSPADAGRVKAWRKHAEAGTLPPILLAWITGLDCHVVLDGHDRLQAAAQAGITPTALTLVGERASPWSREVWQRDCTERYERARVGGARPATLRALQAQVLDAYDPQHAWRFRTRAWALPGGVDAWLSTQPS